MERMASLQAMPSMGALPLPNAAAKGTDRQLRVQITEAINTTYTSYVIKVSFNGRNWDVKRRYNEFSELNEKLAQEFPNEKLRLPPKKAFGNMDSAFVEKRRQDLDRYMQELAELDHVTQSEEVRAFLGIEEGFSAQSRAVAFQEEMENEDIPSRSGADEEATRFLKNIIQRQDLLRTGVYEFVANQKISYLLAGTFLNEVKAKGKPVLRFCRLSGDQTKFYYTTARPGVRAEFYTFEDAECVEISSIQKILVGSEVPSFAKKPEEAKNAFALVLNEGTKASIDFVTLNTHEFVNLVDGFRALKKIPMAMQETQAQIDALMDVEVELVLLNQPPVPQPPPNFQFVVPDV
eukprot:TRINITY_DN17402_c0_g1_i1.p1 TRINITY_DN17402_c0_g1~~TRINITY_DN17402_c0_g1_i1.p1  ORF type:complete len:349 (+),score=79.67 TRINITY_DN17402_c0_g1_i1:54-1100(+)